MYSDSEALILCRKGAVYINRRVHEKEADASSCVPM